MTLIPMDELNQLKSASAVKAVADTALQDLEEMSVAATINTAANTGCHTALWEHPLSDATIQALEAQGYSILQNTKTAYPQISYTIGGF